MDVKEIIKKAGLKEEKIKEKAELAVHTVGDRYIPLDVLGKYKILLGFDMNGPLINLGTAEGKVLPLVPEALSYLMERWGNSFVPAIITGWDIREMFDILKERVCPKNYDKFHIIGEQGQTIHPMEFGIRVGDMKIGITKNELGKIRLIRRIMEIAGDNNIRLSFQPNTSNRICVYFDNVVKPGTHVLVTDKSYQNFTTSAVYNELLRVGVNVNLVDDKILLPLDTKSVVELYRLMSYKMKFIPMRFSKTGSKLAVYVDKDTPESMSIPQVFDFLELLKTNFRISYDLHTHDKSVDMILVEDIFVNKEIAAQFLAEYLLGNRFVVSMVGDEPSDIMTSQNTLFFAMKGTRAEKGALSKGVPYIPVKDGVEYILIWDKILEMMDNGKKGQ